LFLIPVVVVLFAACSSTTAPKEAIGLHPTTTQRVNDQNPGPYPNLGSPSASGSAGVSGASGVVTAPTQAVTPSDVEAFTGDADACPATYPKRVGNPGVQRLSEELVPVEPDKVRLCEYKAAAAVAGGRRLVADGTSTGVGAQRLQQQTNGLPKLDKDAPLPCTPPAASSFLVTFAKGGDTVVVWDRGCSYLTNGSASVAFDATARSVLESSVVRVGSA
jgi:hypothetical protein